MANSVWIGWFGPTQGSSSGSGPIFPNITVDDVLFSGGASINGATANTIKLRATGSTDVLTVTASAVTSAQPMLIPNGTVADPAAQVGQDGDGFYRAGADDVSLSINDTRAIAFGLGSIDLLSNDAYLSMGSASNLIVRYETGGNHWFQRNGANAQRASWANTYTGATNYSAFSVDWQTDANVALVGTRTAATGTGRELRLVSQASNGADSYSLIALSRQGADPLIALRPASTVSGSSVAYTGTRLIESSANLAASSDVQVLWNALPAINQSGTAGYTINKINVTESATGSGSKLLADWQVAGASQFSVSNGGLLNAKSYSVNGAAGASGTGTVISSITVVNGIVTAITVA